MLQLVIVILFASGSSTVVEKKQLLCRSDDLEILYSSCEPCSLKFENKPRWKGFFFWIPRNDITTVFGSVTLWLANRKVLEWTTNLCSGMDDGYSFCGALKGETINTTVNISGDRIDNQVGEYTAIFKAFASPTSKKLLFCMNYTLIKKK
ncbi:lymphocyte antigen 96 isoform X2 [Tiliqua scincoides]|uniref:lymphocyte antigen 96 isoform X2 n=1 Tax=Tiliqua scincoides TaxID=71010 RepID=UPI0034624E5F